MSNCNHEKCLLDKCTVCCYCGKSLVDDTKEEDEKRFEAWWSKERGIDDFPEGRTIVVKEIQLYRWEKEAWLAALKDERDRDGYFARAMDAEYQLVSEREKTKLLVEALEVILSSRTCSSHEIGKCPSSEEHKIYIPAWNTLKKIKGDHYER